LAIFNQNFEQIMLKNTYFWEKRCKIVAAALEPPLA